MCVGVGWVGGCGYMCECMCMSVYMFMCVCACLPSSVLPSLPPFLLLFFTVFPSSSLPPPSSLPHPSLPCPLLPPPSFPPPSHLSYVTNLFSALNDQNPHVSRQREWITSTLELAEEAGEKVSQEKKRAPHVPLPISSLLLSPLSLTHIRWCHVTSHDFQNGVLILENIAIYKCYI